VSFGLTASITRSSGYRDSQLAEVERGNITARLAKDAYAIAVANRSAECASGHGPKCREAETQLSQARSALRLAAPIRAADPGAERLASLLGVSEAAVALYSPMALPLGLELGGFIFLAIGLPPAGGETSSTANKAERRAAACVEATSRGCAWLSLERSHGYHRFGAWREASAAEAEPQLLVE